ncbi:MAG TPA: DUF305 domain-containing protein [Pyrinomonadaceae bacterium]|nr:DUF305 domain-containing protein [Pyrinomonadaceae bacterium]
MKMQNHHYGRFLIMIGLHFIAMYVFMYAMVNVFDNVFNSFNQVYMAALMTASMVLIELPLMSSMYTSKKLNTVILAVGIVALIGSFMMIRKQTLVSDQQFLRSMIPHHAGAILMCKQASIQDAEIQELCKQIVSGQQGEIDLMKRKLTELAK